MKYLVPAEVHQVQKSIILSSNFRYNTEIVVAAIEIL